LEQLPGSDAPESSEAFFELDLKDLIQRDIYWGTFEPNETRLVQEYLRPSMTFLDVGANLGYYTALAASLVGRRGRVIAFEPSPYAFEKLHAMVVNNKLEQSDGSAGRAE
jgi:predicted methyltransferase